MIESGSTLERSLLGAETVQFLVDLDREFRRAVVRTSSTLGAAPRQRSPEG